MRGLIFVGVIGLSFAVLAPGARAQTTFSPGVSDPFFLYYGYYLPRQAALAAQPTVQSQFEQVAVARQNYALADRSGLRGGGNNLFDPEGQSGGDMLAPFARRGGAQRLPHIQQHFSMPSSRNNPRLPHFNELSSRFPTARSGSFVNRNMPGGRAGSGGIHAGAAGGSLPMGMSSPYAPQFTAGPR